MTKNFYLNDWFFVSNGNFTTWHVKISDFSIFFCQNCQILGFSMFSGKVATLHETIV